jgi:hypothetical protein
MRTPSRGDAAERRRTSSRRSRAPRAERRPPRRLSGNSSRRRGPNASRSQSVITTDGTVLGIERGNPFERRTRKRRERGRLRTKTVARRAPDTARRRRRRPRSSVGNQCSRTWPFAEGALARVVLRGQLRLTTTTGGASPRSRFGEQPAFEERNTHRGEVPRGHQARRATG